MTRRGTGCSSGRAATDRIRPPRTNPGMRSRTGGHDDSQTTRVVTRGGRRHPAAVAVVTATAGPVLGAIPEGGVFTACYMKSGGAIRVVDASAPCGKGETRIKWSETGPRGPEGPQGATGAQGPRG